MRLLITDFIFALNLSFQRMNYFLALSKSSLLERLNMCEK